MRRMRLVPNGLQTNRWPLTMAADWHASVSAIGACACKEKNGVTNARSAIAIVSPSIAAAVTSRGNECWKVRLSFVS